jgi:plasmid stabilization system protein ParE
MSQVKFTRRAAFDLDDIEQYSIKKWGENTAARYLDDINLAVQRLKEHPALLRKIAAVSGHLKFYRIREHFLVCDIIDQTIYIVAVRHGRMDLSERIGELEPTLVTEAEFLHAKIVRIKLSK